MDIYFAILPFMPADRSKTIPFKEFKKIYSRVPRLCVSLMLIERGKILLTRRSIPPEQGMWHVPGGTVLFGESLVQAIKGVAKDELGLEVTPGKMVGVIEYGPWLNHYTHDFDIAFLIKKKNLSSTIGSIRQGHEYRFFKTLPKNTITAQKKFLIANLKFKSSASPA